jgi:hypothetical protein
MYAYFGYWMRLSNGMTIPYGNWLDLQENACAAFGCTREMLWHEIAWRIDAPDNWADDDRAPSPGEVANAGLFCGLWTHARRPYPYLCEGRRRRHTARTFLPWGSWIADPPDNEYGSSTP